MAKKGGEIQAAGVVLLRRDDAGTKLCLVHRPQRKDWSLPKGKLDENEHVTLAARRETIEETGTDVILGTPLTTQRYRADGRPKVVHYWVGVARKGGPGFKPNREIDELAWLDRKAAKAKLTYPHDGDLIEAALATPETSPLIILRHTQALRRIHWGRKNDDARPLTKAGQIQASLVAEILATFGIERIFSSDTRRCLDSVRPYSKAIKTRIRHEITLSEKPFENRPAAGLERIDRLMSVPRPLVVCTHRPVLPEVLAYLGKRAGLSPKDPQLNPVLPPGGFVVLHRDFSRKGRGNWPFVVAAERHLL